MTVSEHRSSPRLEKSFAFSAAGVILFTGIFPFLLSELRPSLPGWLYLLLAVIPLQAANIASCLIPARIYEPDKSLAELLDLKKPSLSQYGMIIGGTVCIYLAAAAITGLTIYIMRKIGIQPQEQAIIEMFRKGSPDQIAILIPSAVLLAPLGEELCFRYVFFKNLEFHCGFRTAALLTALIFAAVHMNMQVAPALILLSLWLSELYRRTGTLTASILAHSTFNSLTVILIFFTQIKS